MRVNWTLTPRLATLAVGCTLAITGAAVAQASSNPTANGAGKSGLGLPSAGSHLTIHAQPNPDVTGSPVIIFGQLRGANDAHQTITLWHRLARQLVFTPIQQVTTDANGFYDIPRAEGVVDTNREWFVSANGHRSRVVRERVYAEVTLNGPATALTNHLVVFTGTVTPNHAFQRVQLQQRVGDAGDDWSNIRGATGVIGPGSGYTILWRFRTPGARTLRVVLRADRRNIRSTSAPLDIAIQQAQNPKLTLTASANPIDIGSSVTLSGTLAGPAAGNVTVKLWGHIAHHRYAVLATTTTDSGGAYSFTQTPTNDTVYRVTAAARRSAQVFEIVRDAVTVTQTGTAVVGQTVTFAGTVAPSKVGHVIYLEALGADGDYHVIQIGSVGAGSAYSLAYVLQSPGVQTYRVAIPGGPYNAGGHSTAVTLDVQPPPPSA